MPSSMPMLMTLLSLLLFLLIPIILMPNGCNAMDVSIKECDDGKLEEKIVEIIENFKEKGKISLHDEDRNAVFEVAKIFERMPKEWQELRKEKSPLLEEALIAQIVFNRLMAIYGKYAQQKVKDPKENEKLIKNILEAFEMDSGIILHIKMNLINTKLLNAVQFYVLKENPLINYNVIQKYEELELDIDFKKEMLKQMVQMERFSTWLQLVLEDIHNMGEKNEMGEQILKSLVAHKNVRDNCLFTVDDKAINEAIKQHYGGAQQYKGVHLNFGQYFHFGQQHFSKGQGSASSTEGGVKVREHHKIKEETKDEETDNSDDGHQRKKFKFTDII